MGENTELAAESFCDVVREHARNQGDVIAFTYGEDVVDFIVARCTDGDSGGRMIDNILTNTMLPDISGEFLRRMMTGKAVARVGDTTDHKGVLENGDASWLIN